MYRIREKQFVGYADTTGTNQCVVHVDCDSVSDLPAYNAVAGIEMVMGSTAWDLATGDIYAMDSTHTWKKQ